jgi:hypothetical protein
VASDAAISVLLSPADPAKISLLRCRSVFGSLVGAPNVNNQDDYRERATSGLEGLWETDKADGAADRS